VPSHPSRSQRPSRPIPATAAPTAPRCAHATKRRTSSATARTRRWMGMGMECLVSGSGVGEASRLEVNLTPFYTPFYGRSAELLANALARHTGKVVCLGRRLGSTERPRSTRSSPPEVAHAGPDRPARPMRGPEPGWPGERCCARRQLERTRMRIGRTHTSTHRRAKPATFWRHLPR